MFNHEIFAVSFGRTLDLLRAEAPAGKQKSALRAVYALTSIASAMLRVYQGVLTVDAVGIPETLPFVGPLTRRMAAHRVAEIAIARGATPTELLALLRGLAAEPGPEGARAIKRRLRNVRSTNVMVIPVQPEEGHRPASVSQAFEAEAIAAASAATPEGAVELPAELPPAAPSIELGFRPRAAEAPGQAGGGADAATGEWGPEGPDTSAPPDSHVISADTALGRALGIVAHDPFGPRILDALSELSEQVLAALAEDQVEPALHALVAVIAWEPEAPEGSPRNSYAIVLNRTLRRDVLTQLAQFVSDAWLGPEAAKVMERGRADAAEVLLGLLATTESIKERRAFMNVLRGMPEGLNQVVHMLEHQPWHVVRNVADLMGEQRIEEAVPGLTRCLSHDNVRVRRAAATALAKIGTPPTVEALHPLLKDGDRELRIQIAGSIAGATARALAMPLVALAEQEKDPELLREFYRALGRIGTSNAIQALTQVAQSGGKLIGRRPPEARAAAVEGLRVAGPRAVAALEALVADGDRTVRGLARAALDEIRPRPATPPPRDAPKGGPRRPD
jgi:HEAT repeat protein